MHGAPQAAKQRSKLPWFARSALIACAVMAGHTAARADGFADLKALLLREQAVVTLNDALVARVSGSVRTEVWRRQGEATAADEEEGLATLGFEDSAIGLRLLYPRAVLSRIEQEARARDLDPKARAPTLAAVKALEAHDLQAMLSPTQALLAAIDGCKSRSESPQEWNGRAARRLSCELDIATLKEKERKYVKHVDGRLDIWIGADGTPLATRSHLAMQGRAFIVIGFEMTSDFEQTFQLVDARLRSVREVRWENGSGAGEKLDSRVVRTLTIAS